MTHNIHKHSRFFPQFGRIVPQNTRALHYRSSVRDSYQWLFVSTHSAPDMWSEFPCHHGKLFHSLSLHISAWKLECLTIPPTEIKWWRYFNSLFTPPMVELLSVNSWFPEAQCRRCNTSALMYVEDTPTEYLTQDPSNVKNSGYIFIRLFRITSDWKDEILMFCAVSYLFTNVWQQC